MRILELTLFVVKVMVKYQNTLLLVIGGFFEDFLAWEQREKIGPDS
jgi:hypothetical protein